MVVRRVLSIAIVLLGCPNAAFSQLQARLDAALEGTHAAAVIVDVKTGKALGSHGAIDDITASPGSTLKPFVLITALDAAIIDAKETVHCTGTLVVGRHDLACVHPRQITVFDAQEALANSCNAYFAMVARRMNSGPLLRGLREYGLVAAMPPRTPDDRELLALGVEGITVSPRQLAMAYRALALALERRNEAAAVVKDGLLASVETGMAHAAEVPGMVIAGKTGTAPDAVNPRGHGWFAGMVFEHGLPARVLAIYLPGGNGNDAAVVARRIFSQWRVGP